MQAFKLIANATIIGLLNLTSFVIGYYIFSLSGSGEQRLVQGTAAMIVGVGLVVAWLVVFRRFNRLKIEYDFLWVFFLAFPCTAVIFVPVHYLVTGYLTAISNLSAIGAYQFPMNILAVSISAAILKRRENAAPEVVPFEAG
jgi:hypothetical protein